MEKIIDILKKNNFTMSFEVFPPKPVDDPELEEIFNTIQYLRSLEPDFISVTYSPGGKNKSRAFEIAQFIMKFKINPLSHLTCVGYEVEDIKENLDIFDSIGVKNILSLRGDVPEGMSFPHGPWKDFQYAKNLIEMIKADGRFCIGAAVYPEGHTECKNISENIRYMKEKIESGTDYFITQLFYDNENFFRFIEKTKNEGIKSPVIAGIMPLLKVSQISRIIKLSGASIPAKLKNIIDKYGSDDEEMEKAGLDYAIEQINDLLEYKVDGIHLYTMNKYRQISYIVEQSDLFGGKYEQKRFFRSFEEKNTDS